MRCSNAREAIKAGGRAALEAKWWRGHSLCQWAEEIEGEFTHVCFPLSVLALDHPEPVAGWRIMLEASGIEVVEDDLLRPSIRREDARRLAQERREWERESVEKARRRQESLEVRPSPPVSPRCPMALRRSSR